MVADRQLTTGYGGRRVEVSARPSGCLAPVVEVRGALAPSLETTLHKTPGEVWTTGEDRDQFVT